MKLLRLILLFLGVLLLIGGAVFTGVALDIAESDGYDLFSPDAEVYRLDLSGGEYKALSFSFRSADILLRSDSQRSFVEFSNLSRDTYSLTGADKELCFREKSPLSPSSDFGNGSSFRGLRSLLPIGNSKRPRGRITVYLSPYDTGIQQISIDGTNCTVTADAFIIPCDIAVSGEKTVVFSGDSLLSRSTLTLRGDRIVLSLRDSALSSLTVIADKGNLTAKGLAFQRLDFALTKGSAKIAAFGEANAYSLSIGDGKGAVRLAGTTLSRPLEYRPESPAGSVRFVSEKAELTLWFTGDVSP